MRLLWFGHSRSAADASVTPVRREARFKVSSAGIMFVLLTMFMAAAAVNSQANLLFGVFGLMLGVLLVSGMIRRIVFSRLTIRRVLPDSAIVGQRVTLGYECKNGKRFWPSLSVTISEIDGAEGFIKQPVAYLLHVAARHAAEVRTEAIAKRRGLQSLQHFQISTGFPFGLAKRALDRRQKDSILIYPAIAKVEARLLELCRSSHQHGAASQRPRQGGHDEFYGVKEYRAGDNPRFIYWRRSARTGVLVSKEMTHVAPPRLVLVVDTFLNQRTADGHRRVEQCIAMAASLATHALDAGMVVGLCAWSGSWLQISPSRGKRHQRDLLTALARLPLNTSHDTSTALNVARGLIGSTATAVVFTPWQPLTDLRAGLLLIAAESREAKQYFQFDAGVDFANAMPAGQKLPTRRGKPVKTEEPPAVGTAPKPEFAGNAA